MYLDNYVSRVIGKIFVLVCGLFFATYNHSILQDSSMKNRIRFGMLHIDRLASNLGCIPTLHRTQCSSYKLWIHCDTDHTEAVAEDGLMHAFQGV